MALRTEPGTGITTLRFGNQWELTDDEVDAIKINEYLARELGPRQQFDERLRIFLTVLYSTILLTGICGNLLTIFIIIRNRSLHNTTNIYILNLSVSDLTTLVAGLSYFLPYSRSWRYFDHRHKRTGGRRVVAQ